jgi:hypothetical protein
MAAIIKAFEDIDQDCSGTITRDELYDYMLKKNYKESFIEKWLNLFDSDHTGIVTLENFCNTLGLKPQDDYVEKVERNTAKVVRAGRTRQKPKPPVIEEAPIKPVDEPDKTMAEPEQPSQDNNFSNITMKKLKENMVIIQMDDNMTEEQRTTIIDLSVQSQMSMDDMTNIAENMKKQIEEQLGKVWHVVVSSHPYGSYLGYEENKFIHFAVGKYTFLVWGTPEY